MKKEKSSGNMLERTAAVFDLPADVVAGMPKITLTGSQRVQIENHKGILEYDGNLICVDGGKLIIKIRGEDLELCSMNSEALLITGNVRGIDFE